VARKYVQQIRNQYNFMLANNGGGMMINPMMPDGQVIANYDNPDVIAIRD
jgi:hypothetical protein